MEAELWVIPDDPGHPGPPIVLKDADYEARPVVRRTFIENATGTTRVATGEVRHEVDVRISARTGLDCPLHVGGRMVLLAWQVDGHARRPLDAIPLQITAITHEGNVRSKKLRIVMHATGRGAFLVTSAPPVERPFVVGRTVMGLDS